jgi:hypothetical protein
MRTDGKMRLATIILVMMLAISAFLVRSAPSADAGILNPTSSFRLAVTDIATVQSDPGITWPSPGVCGMFYTENPQAWGPYPPSYTSLESRGYMKFDYASLPQGLEIQQAKLWFFVEAVQSNWSLTWVPGWGTSPYDPLEFWLFTPNADWDMYTINWTNQPFDIGSFTYFITGSTLPRISPYGQPGNSTANTTTYQEMSIWFSIDVTDISRTWYAGAPSYGFFFYADREYGNNSGVSLGGLKAFNPYLIAPYVEITATSKLCQIHLSYYDAFTGEGIAPWSFNVSARIANATLARIVPELTTGMYDVNLTVVVCDFFGNELYNQTKLVNAADFYWDIGLPIYNYKFYNQNPTFALLRIYYNLVGAPYSEFIPPYDYVARYLKAGTYRFNITFYGASGIQGDTYTWTRTIPSITFTGAGFVILQGDTISEVIASVSGMQATVQVLADLVTPDLVWIGVNVPRVPASIFAVSTSTILNNRYVIQAKTHESASGTFTNFTAAIPGNYSIKTIISDYLTFLGNSSTNISINSTTTGNVIYTSTTLLSSLDMSAYPAGNGKSFTIWTNRSTSVTRDIEFRWEVGFTYQYFPGGNTSSATERNLYKADLTFYNEHHLAWKNISIFVPMANASYVDNRSYRIYDMNNTVYLTEGTNFVLTKDGSYMWFSFWNGTLFRGFEFTYTTVNDSRFNIPVTITVTRIGDDSGMTKEWNGRPFYFAVATWTNSYRETYHASLYIVLDLAMSVDSSTIKVLTDTGVIVIGATVNGNTIVIPDVTVNVGDKVSYVILFDTKTPSSPTDISIAGIPVLYVCLVVGVVSFIIGALFVAFRKEESMQQFGRIFMGIAVLCFIIVVTVLIYYAGVG